MILFGKKMRNKNILTFIAIILSFLITFIHIYISSPNVLAAETKATGKKWTFSYTGEIQSFTAPYTGTYHIQVGGASGGGLKLRYGAGTGRQGGYVSGYYDLQQGDTIYIAVGGEGSASRTGSSGGWNGGGSTTTIAASGGGATSVVKSLRGDGQLYNYEDYQEDIIAVAGGGAGAAYSYSYIGYTICDTLRPNGEYHDLSEFTYDAVKNQHFGKTHYKSNSGCDSNGNYYGNGGIEQGYGLYGTGATQTSGYKFGIGQDGSTVNNDGYSSGAGGGFFGGKAVDTSAHKADVSGGGSGYYCSDLRNVDTQSGISYGNGYVNISYIQTESVLSVFLNNYATYDSEQNMITAIGNTNERFDLSKIKMNENYELVEFEKTLGDGTVDGDTFIFGEQDTYLDLIAKCKLNVLLSELSIGYDRILTLNAYQSDSFDRTFKLFESIDGSEYVEKNELETNYLSTLAKRFEYTGSVQEYVVPISGYYKLTCVGGGNVGSSSNLKAGGKGSYASGVTYLEEGTKLYIYVGARENTFNGGGSVQSFTSGGMHQTDYPSTNAHGYRYLSISALSGASTANGITPGSGATDIRLIKSTAGDGWSGETSLLSRLVTAGGGGGRSEIHRNYTHWILPTPHDQYLSTSPYVSDLQAYDYGSSNGALGQGSKGGVFSGSKRNVSNTSGNGYSNDYVVSTSAGYGASGNGQDVYVSATGGGGGGWYGGKVVIGGLMKLNGTNTIGINVHTYAGTSKIQDGYTYNDTTFSFQDTKIQEGYSTANGYAIIQYLNDGLADFSANVPINDKAAPDTPFAEISFSETNLSAEIFDTNDNGTTYQYKINSYISDNEEISDSYETEKYVNLSGLKGYYWFVDDNADSKITDDTKSFTDGNTIDLTDYMNTSGCYLHIAAVDNAGNISGTFSLRIDKYFVQFDPNGAEIESDEDLMDIMDCYFGNKYKIPECEYSRYGYVFNGWSISPNGTGQIYKTGDEFIDLASEAGEYVILYAQWLPDNNTSAKLYVDPNSGVYRGSEQVQLFTWSPVSSTTHSYYYTGGYQTFTCPADGWYFLEAMGAQGGSDACAGGKGGYVKSYVKLTKGQKLYIGVGQSGWCSGGAANLANNPTYGAGGRTACNWDSYPICSGVGGGATIVATELCGNGDIRHYANNKNSLLVVAGGGGGGSNTRAGAGGTVLYNSNGVANGASTSLLNGTFGLGSNHGNASGRAEDGGGGGGGYIGGVVGWDDAGYGSHGSGGGASFVNTSRGCYDAVLIPNYRAGNGFVRITCFPDDAAHALTPDPYRTGWSFVGWELNNGKSSGAVYLHHNTIEPLWWVDFKKGTAYVQSVWRRTMSITLDADQTMNYINGQAVSRGESTWTQTITDNPTKHFRWDSNVLSSGRTFTNDMTREKGVYTVQLARNDGNGSVMELISLGNTQSSAANGTVGTFGSDDVIIYNSGVYAGEIKTYPRFRGWSTERFVQGEYLGTYKGKVIAGSGSWINLKTQNANRASYKQYLYNIEGNRYPAAGNIGYELDARLAKYNTKLGISPYDKLNITIYPTWYRSTIKLPDAKRNSDKTGNGETPDLFIGWFTEPQLDEDTNYGGEFVGRAGDVVVVDRDITLYPWFNKAPTIYRSEIGNGGNSGTFWEGEPISYEQLLTLVNANDKDNYVDINKRNEEIQWNGIDAWNDGIDDWNNGEQAWGGNTNAYTPGDDSHGESQNWNDDVAATIDWETFSKTNAWKTLYTLNVDVYLHDYVYNSPDFASLTDVEKDALIEDAKQRLLDYENQYDTNNQDDNNDFQVFITGISYYCDGVDTKGVPTKSNPDVANVDASGNYLQSHIEKLYSNNYSATNGRYDGYEVEYDNMYDVNANGLQTDTPFVGKIVIHYAIVDNGTFDFYNDKYVSTANGYTIDSNIVVQFDLETEIKFDTRPKYETHSLVIYSSDPDWNADNVKEKVLAKQILTDVEDNMNNHPWWYKDVTTPALIQTKEIINIENIMFQDYFEHEHEAVCDRIKRIDDIEALFRLKESSDEEEVEAFKHIVNFDVIVDAHDQWNKYVSDSRCGQNKTERTFKVIMFNNFDDDDIFYGSYREALRYIDSDWTDTLGETSYWNDSMYGQPVLETTFTRYVDRGSLTASSYTGVIVNATPDDANRTINITVNDYSD